MVLDLHKLQELSVGVNGDPSKYVQGSVDVLMTSPIHAY